MTFVLVPGAWHLPSSYDLLRGELDARGRASIAVKLPSNGPDARGGLEEDAAAIRAAIEAVGGPAIVVAHSYGGIPATQAAVGLQNVRHLIYVAAFVPDAGESAGILRGMPDPEVSDIVIPFVGDDPRAQLYADVPGPVADAAVGRLVGQRLQAFVDRVTDVAWYTVPSTYIFTEQDAFMPAALQEKMSARTKDVRRMAASHSPFLSRPAELAALLDEIAGH